MKLDISKILKCKQHVEISLDKDETANSFPRNLGQKLGLSNL